MSKDKNALSLDRLKHLIDKEPSRQFIADRLGCDVSLITKHYNGDRVVTLDYLVKYAYYFDVSTDYLLGLSPEPTADTDLRAVCEYTGLEKETVYHLNRSTTRALQNAVNFLFSDSAFAPFAKMIDDFEEYKNERQDLSKIKKKIADYLPNLPIKDTASDEVLLEYQKTLEKLELIEFKALQQTKTLMNEYVEENNTFEDETRFRAVYEYLIRYNSLDYYKNGENKTNGKYTRRKLERDMKYFAKSFSEEFKNLISDIEKEERVFNAHNPETQ